MMLILFEVGQHRVDLLLPLAGVVLQVSSGLVGSDRLRLWLPILFLHLPLNGLVVVVEEGGLSGVEGGRLLRILGRLGPNLVESYFLTLAVLHAQLGAA